MAAAFDICMTAVFDAEGGYADNPNDRGGRTNYGITEGFLESIGNGKMPADITREEAKDLYHEYFWAPVNGDDLPPPVALIVFDMAVNSGVKTAVRRLQYVLNYYKPVVVDGVMGPKTLAAVQSAFRQYSNIFLGELLHSRREYYAGLIRKNPSQGVFARGWNNRINKLMSAVADNNWTR